MVNKIIITDNGDISVGIQPAEITITANFDLVEGLERTDIRKDLGKLFKEIYELIDPVYVTFEDECWDCGRLLTECKCREDLI